MSASHSDRNVLFGILALQMEFITQAGLIAALQAWTLQKSRPLGELLVELGHMSAEDRAALEPMVDRHVVKHGGSVEQSLAALSSVSEVAEELRELPDADLQQTLLYVAAPESRQAGVLSGVIADPVGDDIPAQIQPAILETMQQEDQPALRFQLLRPHAEGGLGKVWIARDRELNREVAFKEIKPKRAQDKNSRGRFVLEAEITGGLEHPGIVPVYGLGHFADGRPFYAMRFIRGHSLQEASERFHSTHRSRSRETSDDGRSSDVATKAPKSHDFGYESLAFRKLVQRLIDVCNAIAYAHSRGVLHRDLKPGNIMLGKYGETLVVDWGLAKVKGQTFDPVASGVTQSIDQEPALSASGSQEVAATQMGSAIGTPAYMSPEQAAGRLDLLGPAADVYSLGATLYHLLTGQPPFVGKSMVEILRRVQAGDFPRPSDVVRSLRDRIGSRRDPATIALPKPLEAICLKAMSLRPSDRYASPQALAEDLERWLADDPVSAWPEPVLVRARRWVKRHPTLVVSTAATVLISLVSLAAIASVIGQSNRSLADKNQELDGKNRQLDQSNAQLGQSNAQLAQANTDLEKANVAEREAKQDADQKRSDAEKARQEAVEQTAIAAAVNEFFQNDVIRQADSKEQADRKTEVNPNLTLREALDRAAERIGERFQGQELTEAAIQLAIGDAYRGVGAADKGIPHLERSVTVRQAKLGPDHPDTLVSANKLAHNYYDEGKQDLALPLFEETLKLRKATLGLEHPETLESMNNLAASYRAAGKLDQALPLYEETLKLKKANLGPDHPDTLVSMNNLAVGYRATGKLDQALTLDEETLKLRKAKLGPDHPDTLRSMNNLAVCYGDSGRMDQALTLLTETLKLRQEKHGPDHPETLNTMFNLATGYKTVGKLEQSLPIFEEMLRLMKARFGPDHPGTLVIMNNVAAGYRDAGNLDQALPHYEETLKLRQAKLSADHPDTLNTMNGLAITYMMAKQPDKAMPLFEQFIAGHRGRAKPDDPVFAGHLAAVSGELLKHHQYSAAEAYVRECLAIREKKLPDDWVLFNTKSLLGGALAGQKKFQEAEPLLVEGYEGLKAREAKIAPASKTRLPEAMQRLIDLYTAWEKPEEAAKWKQKLNESLPDKKEQKDEKD